MTIPVQNGWARCPEGELTRLATRLRVRHLLRVSLSVAAALVLGAGLTLAVTRLVSDRASPSTVQTTPCHESSAPAPATGGCQSQIP